MSKVFSPTDRLQAGVTVSDVRLMVNNRPLGPFGFSLAPGDVCEICSRSSEDVRHLLKFLATLIRPLAGQYHIGETCLDFSDYRSLLPFKRRIAYMTADAALITNRTLLENLLLPQAWYENTITPRMEEKTIALCRMFNLEEKLSFRPGHIGPMNRRSAVVVRELAKDPDLILMERPEDFVGMTRRVALMDHLRRCAAGGASVLFWSEDPDLAKGWANRTFVLENGCFEELVSGQPGRE